MMYTRPVIESACNEAGTEMENASGAEPRDDPTVQAVDTSAATKSSAARELDMGGARVGGMTSV
jgi:hypothetical protein